MQGLCKDRAAVSLCPNGTKAECQAGKRCNTLNNVCEEDLGCSDDGDCGAAEKCNTGSHVCGPACTVDTQQQICAVEEHCINAQCAQCATDAECSAGLVCDAAGKCSSGARCYQDRDCKVPLVCYAQTGECLAKPPPCVSDENCAPEKRCDVGAGRCVPRGCQADRFEPNNDAAHAFGVTASRYTALTLCPGDLDFFALSLARGDQLGVNLDADPFAESTFTTSIRDTSGRTLASGRLLVSYVAPVAATYFVAVSTTDNNQPYDATFLLSRGTPCDDDSFEPNDLPAQATPINGATTVDGAICPQDQDHFRAQVPAGKGVTATLVNYTSSHGLLTLCLLNGSTVLACSEAASAPTVAANAATVGGKSVLVRVSGTNDRVSNTYSLEVSFP